LAWLCTGRLKHLCDATIVLLRVQLTDLNATPREMTRYPARTEGWRLSAVASSASGLTVITDVSASVVKKDGE